MPSIGETLREARMRQRLDIADIEERTKIRAKYLRALENEEFSMLPGSTFVKTFIRTYAELLGLDPHVLVEEYRTNYERTPEEVQPLTPPAVATRERDRRRRPAGGGPGPGTFVVIGLAAMLAFLIVLGLLGGDEEEEPEQASETPPAETETETQTATAPAEKPAPKKKAKPRKRRKRRAAPKVVSVRLAPIAPTYACLDRGPDTDIVFEGTLSEARTFKAKKLRANIGKTSVQVKVNGKTLKIEPGPQPVGFEFSPTGTKSLPLGQRPCA